MSVYIGFYYGDTSNINHTRYPKVDVVRQSTAMTGFSSEDEAALNGSLMGLAFGL